MNARLRITLAGLVAILAWTAARADDKPDAKLTPLFNGMNLDGWVTKNGESLDGKTEAYKGRFKISGGNLIIDPKVKGDVTIETAKKYKDVQIQFQFLPEAGCNNDLFLRGAKFDLKKGVKHLKEGEWNDLEIVSRGDSVEFKCNGQSERTFKAKGEASAFGIRAEFGSMQVRKLTIKELR